MPVEVSQLPKNDNSKVASPSSTSSSTNALSNSSSDQTIPHPSRHSLETSKAFNESLVISPPSPKPPGNFSTEPSKRSTPPPKAPENSTNPPKRSPPPPSTVPPQNLSPPPPRDNAPLFPPPPPPDLPKRHPPPQTDSFDAPPSVVSPPPPISNNELHPSPPSLSPPPFSRTRDSPPSPPSPLLSPPPPLPSPPSTSGTPVSPNPPLLSPLSSPSMTSLVPPQTPTNQVLNNAPEHSNSDGYGIGTGGAVGIGLTVSFLLLGSIGIIIWCLCWRKKKYSRQSNYLMPTSLMSSPSSDSELLKMQRSPSHASYAASETSGLGNSRSVYTYKELSKATNQFSKKNLLGEGGFGLVYKGHFPDGREVAVKQLKEGGGQGEREFRAEVETISHIHHKHLVSLIGYCICKSRRLLVYDFVPNNTLHFHLHENGDHVLDWAARFRIAIGTARGIAYLHEDCHPRIIHRDIKSSNILIDNNFEAQVSDFGLARLFSDTYTHVTTRVMGTFGYMAPEYALSGKLTEKSDVFSFGVVLLELITGRKPVDSSQPSGEESLVEWARPLLNIALESDEFEALVDPRLENNYVDNEMFRVIEAAASCVRHLASKRPKIIQIVRAFDSVVVVSDLTNGMRVGESKMFDSTQESAEFRLLQNMAFGGQNYSSSSFTRGTWKSED